MLNISFVSKDIETVETIFVMVNHQGKMDSETTLLDNKHHGLISKTLQDKQKFKGKYGQAINLTTTNKQGEIRNIAIICIGDETKLSTPAHVEVLGGKIHGIATKLRAKLAALVINTDVGNYKRNRFAALIASGALLGSYRFEKYHTKKTEEQKFITEDLEIITEDIKDAETAFMERKAIAMGVFLARDCVNEAPNHFYPASYAEKIVDELDPLGVDVEVIGEREMTNLGMGALLGVGQGSANESKMVIMKYFGSEDEDEDPICFVGKGVTFDTGGISLKPAASMHEMKYDMGGSAAVVGALKALALRKAKVNVVGIVGLVENMPGGNAQRPGDIVTTMSGQTVEVLNTDAEGRLVLCDCVWYLQENFKPKCVIDLATLTGAILISLANTYAGCFANNDELAKNLISSSLKTDEKLWRMPLHKEYNEMLKSPVADIANIGGERGMAGSSTAAHFIERFIKKDVKWAHLDIAGVAWNKKPTNPLVPFGGVGFGVRLLNQFVQDHYEQER